MISVEQLHPLEIRTLRVVPSEESFVAMDLITSADLNLGQCNQAFSWLIAKESIIEVKRVNKQSYELTSLGKKYQKEGLFEERILSLLSANGPLPLPEIGSILGLEQRDVGTAYGALSREKIVSMDEDNRVAVTGDVSKRVAVLRRLMDRMVSELVISVGDVNPSEQKEIISQSRKRGSGRGLFRVIEDEIVSYKLTETGKQLQKSVNEMGLTGIEVGALTPKMLTDGSWRRLNFRRYNVNSPPGRILLGRRNPYNAYLDRVRNQLIGLGFEEFDGPLVETNFWCCDALFMPQFHVARDEHDVYFIKEPRETKDLPEPFFSRVEASHVDGGETESRGWGYRFDRNFAKRTILRSHGTVVSAKTLTRARVPGKYFGIMRCFRPDEVDSSHLADFYQTEGIVLGENVNLRTLLGLLKLFAEEIVGVSSDDVRYEPAYFPFTEPSVEVFVRHPKVGWTELGGAGIFRPEVTQPLGVEVPVLAWGLGIDRMAMVSLGIDDIRDLFSTDLHKIRLRVGC